ncbi:hypothetical protein AB1Y20_022786 [Prymnesium parvum]|uniref:Uncharacterized protein n=1 Tax=Prymnesium parvum TaxID=97485 RepID=A0AB34JDM0_PRYPA
MGAAAGGGRAGGRCGRRGVMDGARLGGRGGGGGWGRSRLGGGGGRTDHSAYSPGERPDLYIPSIGTALDVKTMHLPLQGLQHQGHRRGRHLVHGHRAANAEIFLLSRSGLRRPPPRLLW